MSTRRKDTGTDAVDSPRYVRTPTEPTPGYRTTNAASDDGWWRLNRSIRCYGLILLVGTKIADIVTTAIGVRYIPAIVEANPVADGLFVEWGLFTGLAVLGFATVVFATCAAELFGIEVRRRFGLPKTALFAQASIYFALSALFAFVALHNTLLIAEQVTYMLDDILVLSAMLGS